MVTSTCPDKKRGVGDRGVVLTCAPGLYQAHASPPEEEPHQIDLLAGAAGAWHQPRSLPEPPTANLCFLPSGKPLGAGQAILSQMVRKPHQLLHNIVFTPTSQSNALASNFQGRTARGRKSLEILSFWTLPFELPEALKGFKNRAYFANQAQKFCSTCYRTTGQNHS